MLQKNARTSIPDSPEASTKDRFAELLRATTEIFAEQEFGRLVPGMRSLRGGTFAPILETERIAFDFLVGGGKRFRPFLTLAAFQSLRAPGIDIAEGADRLPDAIKRAAVAIEAFHKASLVHDDIEDDDEYRYGRQTLHRQYDTATAINVGDYLVGLGYRLITGDRETHGSDRAADILHELMDAHVRLSEGQGAELAWRSQASKTLRQEDALEIYALKTSPAFEAALYTGVRLASDDRSQLAPLREFCRHLGIAFQILNDLKDWNGDQDNKILAGQDVLAMRPTVLLAVALERADGDGRRTLDRLLHSSRAMAEDCRPLCDLFKRLDVFDAARDKVASFRASAEESAKAVEDERLRHLLCHLVKTLLTEERSFIKHDGHRAATSSRHALTPSQEAQV